MKKTLAIALASVIALTGLTGCQTVKSFVSSENAKIAAWWANPATQAAIAQAAATTEQALLSFGLNVATQELNGGKVNWTQAGLAAGATAVRQLELTPNAQSAAAITQNVMTVVQDPVQAKAIASAVVKSVSTATQNGADPSGTLEGIAQGLDTAAATVKVTTGN